MKKLLLYISVIFFAICSSAWSEDLNGKALHCIWFSGDKHPSPTHVDQEDTKYIIFIDNKNITTHTVRPDPPFPIDKASGVYTTDNNYIYIDYIDYEQLSLKLDRKTLFLSLLYHLPYDDMKKVLNVYKCKLYTKKGIMNELNRIKNKYHKQHEEFNKKEREGNKI